MPVKPLRQKKLPEPSEIYDPCLYATLPQPHSLAPALQETIRKNRPPLYDPSMARRWRIRPISSASLQASVIREVYCRLKLVLFRKKDYHKYTCK